MSDDEQFIVSASKIGRVYLIRTSDMKPLWSFDTRGAGHWADIAPDNKYVLVGSGGSYGRILFDFNGSITWFGPVSASGIALDEDLLSWIDEMVKNKRFANRTHAIEYALQRLREREKEELHIRRV